MSGLSARFLAMSLSDRMEFVLARTCSPEARNVVARLLVRVSELEVQVEPLNIEVETVRKRMNVAETRVAELEAERDAIMGISRDCDGTATTPLEAFKDLLKAFEVAVTDRAELGRALHTLRLRGEKDG